MSPESRLIVRFEGTESDERSAVRSVNVVAFGRSDEADLVGGLRLEGAVVASLVAERDGRIVGHALFSRMWIETAHGSVSAVALAPLAVLPEFQRQGIGGLLVERGLGVLRERGEGIAIVLGHPHYYGRFGFSCEGARELESPFPPDAFMAMELRAGALDGVRGAVRYAASFGL